MNNYYGFAGRILKVDLTQGLLKIEESEPYVREFLGGRGLGQSSPLPRPFSGNLRARSGESPHLRHRPVDSEH